MRVNCIFEKKFLIMQIFNEIQGKIHKHIMQCFICTAKECNNKFVFEMNKYQQQGSMQNK